MSKSRRVAEPTGNVWPTQDAKARFSELLDRTVSEGPQVVTRRGVETAVMVPIEEWRRVSSHRRSVKDLLLAATPRFENLVPARKPVRTRPAIKFD
jgi:antitoxin Phd